jgi:hypothetical protein
VGDVDLSLLPATRPHVSLDFPLEGWLAGAIWPGTFGIVGSHVSRGAYRMFAPGFSAPARLAPPPLSLS